MEGQQNIEKDNTTESQESLKAGKSSLSFASTSIRPNEKSAKLGRKLDELKDVLDRSLTISDPHFTILQGSELQISSSESDSESGSHFSDSSSGTSESWKSVEKHEKYSTIGLRKSLKEGKFKKSAEYFEDETYPQHPLFKKRRTQDDPFTSPKPFPGSNFSDSSSGTTESWKSVEKHEKYSTTGLRKSLKKRKFKESSEIEDETYRQHHLSTKYHTKEAPFTSPEPFPGSNFPILSGTTEYGAGPSTSSRSKVVIKLSAKRLVSRRENREKYLFDTFKESLRHRGSKQKPVLVELLVDLTEIELEIGKQVARQITSDSDSDSEYFGFPFYLVLQDCDCSVAVSQTEEKNKVSDCTIKTFSEIFYQLNRLLHPKSVDVSGCTLLTQVSLLPGLLSAHGLEWPSVRVVCQFSTDFLHLEEDECRHFLNVTKSLVVQGDISKEQFQELINKLFSLIYSVYRNEKVTHALIEAGADVNITDKDGKTTLFYSVNRNEKVTHALIEAGADVNITNKNGKTALFYVVYNEKVTHALIEAGADVNITDKDGKTALFYVVYNEKVTHALIEAGADVNITDKDGKTALFYAVDHEKVTHALIEAGADVNITDKDGKTALFYAVDNEEVTHALIEAGADVNTTDKDGKTALFYVNWNEKVIHALIEADADVNTTDKDGKTALFYGSRNEKVTNALIEAGADVNITDNDGKTALFFAVKNEEETHALIKAHPDVNITDKDGKTALFYAVQNVYNDKVTHALIEAGADVNITDKNGKTVLLHIFEGGEEILKRFLQSSSKGFFRSLIEFLLENGTSLCETTEKEYSIFHLILKLYQQTILSMADKEQRWYILLELFYILKLFCQSNESKVAVNIRDSHLNSPLHHWATLCLPSLEKYHDENMFGEYSFENLLKEILDLLLECGVLVDDRNEIKETPLHWCRTWTAAKLLLDAGVGPNAKDSSGCTPLLAAAKRNTCIKKDSERFYPDVDQIPKEFWKEVSNKGLDPWTADKNGNSVLSILIQKEANCLAKALIEVACELKVLQSNAIGVLITICKDKSSDKEWKVDLVETLLKYQNSLAQESLSDKNTALLFCCMNMLELPENSVKTSVHWKIVQHLILCGADVKAIDNEGKSCLDIAESCPVLKELLQMPVNIEEVPPLIDSWKPVAKRHQGQLEKVSRGINCQQIEMMYYYKEALDNGTFGLVFVGINTQDGKEVAVKRIEKLRVDKENLKEEIKDLKLVMSNDKVIQCLLHTDDKEFVYVVLELMEGNLDDLLSDGYDFGNNQEIKLCRDICTGLDYLHNHDIIHKAIKPTNILYQVPHSGINLKLAYFGLRSQMCKEQCTSAFTDTYESLTEERRWMAPEVLQSQSHSKFSDVFSCGLVIHYLLTNKKHPFAPAGLSEDSPLTVSIETVDNIIQNRIELDETISSDAKDLLNKMLDHDNLKRKGVSSALQHKFFQP